jgi:cytochrome c biogenesis protein CcdA/thiol-disulfide isomerase/thioredoxin
MLLLLIAFIAGILTILAPCVLPLLPVIIGGSISGNKKDKFKPYIICAALAFSIIFFTLILKFSTFLIGFSSTALDWVSGTLLIGLGVVGLLPDLWEKLVIKLNWQAASQRFLGRGERNKNKYIGPVLIGVALGPVFASCSPTYAFILASVLPVSFLAGLFYLAAYSIGLAGALLAVSIGGKRVLQRYAWAVNTHGLFRRLIGFVFIIIGVVIILGQQIKIETWVANHLPFEESQLEQTLLSDQQKTIAPSLSSHGSDQKVGSNSALNVVPTVAPNFVGLTNWINSKPLTLASLHGKVVLVDFWTYSCVNCIRSLPFVEKWYQTYGPKGLVVVGINTPEFAFEHNPTNVANAVKRYGVTYPVALDNNYDTWDAYDNTSWPADYLIDKDGYIRYVSLGEGNYNVTERAIQNLLGINAPLQTPVANPPISDNQTPETYLGSNRSDSFTGTSKKLKDGSYQYTPTPTSQIPLNSWTLSGDWQINPQAIVSTSAKSTITISVAAKDVYLVAGSNNGRPVPVNVFLPSNLAGNYGPDAPGGILMLGAPRLYHIIALPSFNNTIVTLTVPSGISLYTFTFGS